MKLTAGPGEGARVTRCCVLVPYYNAGEALLATLESLGSTADYDVIVIDDGSEAMPAASVLAGSGLMSRTLLVEVRHNAGIEHALNAGIEAAGDSYEYVARLDCGDICINDRIARQIAFLDAHPECALVGGWADLVDMQGRRLYGLRPPPTRREIRKAMFVNNPFIHSTVMMRTDALRQVGGYPTDRPAAEDFALFVQMVERFDAANIQATLVQCVVDPNGISTLRRREQLRSRIALLVQHFEPRPIAVYGILRAAAQLATPRSVTVWVNSWRDRLRQRLPSPARRPL